MPIFKVSATRVTAEVAEVYVYADDEAQAREKVTPDLDEIIDCYSAWDIDDFACDKAEIDRISEVEKAPKGWEIDEDLDFRIRSPEEPDPVPEDPRQMRMFDD